jgi:nitrous oxidase accessory protein
MTTLTSRLPRTLRATAPAVLVLFACAILSRSAGAAELEVPSSGLPTLQAGLDAARAGDVLRLKPGTYRGPVVVTKPVTLAPGAGAEGAVVLAGGGAGRVVEVWAPGVALRGLRVRNSGDDVENTDACIYVHGEAAGVYIADNVLEGCLFGIWVNGAHKPRIERNHIAGIVKPIFSDRGNGINLWHVENALVRRNVIREVRDGIYLSVSTDSEVRDNLMHNLRFGIHYMYNDQNVIAGNVACNSLVGLALMFSKRLEIRENLALNNRDHGILFRTILDSRIVANRALGNGKGIFLNDSSFNELEGNHVADNAIGVHLTAGSEDNRVHGNNFVANPVQIRFTWSRAIRWDHEGRGNYWSDYLGWDMNRDGLGDRVHHASNRIDMLMFRYPQMKLLAASPVVQLMQVLEARMPVLRPPSIVDRHPAMRPFPAPAKGSAAFPPPALLQAACGALGKTAGS